MIIYCMSQITKVVAEVNIKEKLEEDYVMKKILNMNPIFQRISIINTIIFPKK